MGEESKVKEILARERAATIERIRAMRTEHDGIVASSADSNSDDEHDPEGSTIAFERAQLAALLIEARAYLDDLDRASVRLAAGTYGVCEKCGVQIAPERLVARPTAQTCFQCASRD